MKHKNEQGVTLVELLAAILILGFIVVPISTYLLTGTYTRTVSQGKENQLLYFAQEIMEKQRNESSRGIFTKTAGITYSGACALDTGCEEPTLADPDTEPDARYDLFVEEYHPNSKFLEVKVIVYSTREVTSPVELVTVVRKSEAP